MWPGRGGAEEWRPTRGERGIFLSGEFIVGRVIKAVNRSWHPGCFLCELCGVQLADLGFVRNAGR